jgi:hypothetical protein
MSSAAPVSSGGMKLDEVIMQAARRMEERLPGGAQVAIVSVASPSTAFSSYVIDALEAALVDKGALKVVDRANLDKIRAEQGFQLSGDVSDASAKALGQLLGAGAIVTGSLLNIGSCHRLTLKAINIESAEVAVSFPADIANDERVRALLGQTSNAGLPPAPRNTIAGSATAQTPAVLPPAPVRPAMRAAPGALYSGNALQGEMDLLDALDWISLNAQSGGNYTIALGRDEAITPTELSYGGKTLTITLKSAGGEHTVSFAGASPSYSLFNVKSGVTLTLEDDVTLRGIQNGGPQSLVEINGGRFVMNGGVITGNKTEVGGGVAVLSGTFTMNGGVISGNTVSSGSGGSFGTSSGGGVYVASGAFIMNGGVISGNTAPSGISLFGSGGGGVYVASGTFTMNGGTISENTTSGNGGGILIKGTFIMKDGVISGNTADNAGSGGGVYANTITMSGGAISGNTGNYGGGAYIASGPFTMSGGSISGNTARDRGGGVWVQGTFTKSGNGGVIYGSNAEYDQANRAASDSSGHVVYAGGKKRNTTARAATAMDSTKAGPAGGWE